MKTYKAMKNIFKRNDNTSTWIAAAIAGAITIGAVAYLYFRKREDEAAEDDDHAADYLQVRMPKKRKRSDVADLEDIAAQN